MSGASSNPKLTVADNVATTGLEAVGLSCHWHDLSFVVSSSTTPRKMRQNWRIELLINGLQVRVLPGSPLSRKDLLLFPLSLTFPQCGEFWEDSIPSSRFIDSCRTSKATPRNQVVNGRWLRKRPS